MLYEINVKTNQYKNKLKCLVEIKCVNVCKFLGATKKEAMLCKLYPIQIPDSDIPFRLNLEANPFKTELFPPLNIFCFVLFFVSYPPLLTN